MSDDANYDDGIDIPAQWDNVGHVIITDERRDPTMRGNCYEYVMQTCLPQITLNKENPVNAAEFIRLLTAQGYILSGSVSWQEFSNLVPQSGSIVIFAEGDRMLHAGIINRAGTEVIVEHKFYDSVFQGELSKVIEYYAKYTPYQINNVYILTRS